MKPSILNKKKSPKIYGNKNELKSKVNNFITEIKKKTPNSNQTLRSKSPNSNRTIQKAILPPSNENLSQNIVINKNNESDMFNQSFGCNDKLKAAVNENKDHHQDSYSENSELKENYRDEKEDISSYEDNEEIQIDQVITNIRNFILFLAIKIYL